MRLVLVVGLETRQAVEELTDEASSSLGLFGGLMIANSTLFELYLVDDGLSHGL
jgi:hypothetical protein